MYLRFYGLNDYPFSITPDPAFLYLSPQHREALGHLLYGTGEHGGFVQLTGEVGTGKTTLIRTLLEQDQDALDVALCLNPRLTVTELVELICDELGVERSEADSASLKTLVDALNRHLLESHAAGRRTVLIVDEAQNLSRDVLEQLRLLTNLETHTHKLMRIMLVGQPELDTVLRQPDLRQLAQRITARYHLRALNRAEATAYIRHRLQVVDGPSDLFTDAACSAAYLRAGGIPRLINTICERALMGGYSLGRRRIGASIVRQAANEALPQTASPKRGWPQWRWQWPPPVLPAALVAGALVAGFLLHYGLSRFGMSGEVAPAQAADAAGDTEHAGSGDDGNGASDGGQAAQAVADTSAGDQAAASSGPAAPAPDDTDGGGGAQQAAAAAGGAAEPEMEPLPGEDADINQLLRLWGVFGEPVDTPCDQLTVGDLRCITVAGELPLLARLNRPALIELAPADGPRRHALLTNLEAGTATLIFGEGTRRMPRARLAGLLAGEARLIWRKPIEISLVQPGSVGSAVVWVRRLLAQAEGSNLDNQAGRPSPVFDDELEAQVRRFQERNGLLVDGMVGPQTMLAMNNIEPPPGTPFLTESEAGD